MFPLDSFISNSYNHTPLPSKKLCAEILEHNDLGQLWQIHDTHFRGDTQQNFGWHSSIQQPPTTAFVFLNYLMVFV